MRLSEEPLAALPIERLSAIFDVAECVEVEPLQDPVHCVCPAIVSRNLHYTRPVILPSFDRIGKTELRQVERL
jgi:hypothetical protein